jgi:putative aldouronate transport system substrate-binding protein
MKKVTLGVILLLCFLTFAGCKDKEPSDETAVAEGSAYTQLTLYSDVEFWRPPAWDITEGTITGDISKNTGVTVDVTVPARDADRQLSLMLINNDLPDIISITDQTVMGQLVTSGKVWDLEEFFEKYKPDSQFLKDFPADVKKELVKRDGGWYAVPSHIESQDSYEIWKPSSQYYRDLVNYEDSNTIIWNKELLERCGLHAEDLKTEEDILAAFEKIKRTGAETDGSPVIPLLVDGDAYQENTLTFLENTYGAEYVDENGNYKDIMLQPETKDALYFINQSVRAGYMDPGQMTLDNDEIKKLMASGRVLCFIGNISNTGIDSRLWVSSGPIRKTEDKRPVHGKNMRASTGWIGTFISKDCEHPEKAADWIDYMTSDEGAMLWCFGYEGIHYTRDANGLVSWTEEGDTATKEYSKTGVWAWWMFANTAWQRSVMAPLEEGTIARAQADLSIVYAKDKDTVTYDSSLLSGLTEALPPNSEYQKMETNISAWKKSQIPAMLLAADDGAFNRAYETFIERMGELGIQELDAQKDIKYKENCAEYGRSIGKVN